MTGARNSFLAKRAELLAELLLQEMEPAFLGRPDERIGWDFFIGFARSDGGINTAAVEVKLVEPGRTTIKLPVQQFSRLAITNIPVLLLGVEPRDRWLGFAWLNDYAANVIPANNIQIQLAEVTEAAKRTIRQRILQDA
jgi:hypothetical protein